MECSICLKNESRWDTIKGGYKPICISCLGEMGYEQDEDTGEWVLPEPPPNMGLAAVEEVGSHGKSFAG